MWSPKRLLYEIRWWKWFLIDSPSPWVHWSMGSAKPLDALDIEAYEILQRRWEAKEPNFKGAYPHRMSSTYDRTYR